MEERLNEVENKVDSKIRSDKPRWTDKYNILKALNEKIVGMGYSYSLLSFFKSFLIFSVVIIGLGYFHKMKFPYVFILIIFYFMLLPFSVYSQYKYLYEQKRFQELCTYMKQMKINFKTYKKILVALKETEENFKPGDRIYPYIHQAIEAIENGTDYRTALDIIEKPFKNSFITKLHAYMILGETEGGDAVFQALDNIDYDQWRTDTFIFQTQKYKYQNQNGFYTIFGLAISLFVVSVIFQRILTDAGTVMYFIFDDLTFQLETFVYILIDMVSYVMIKTMITSKWVREDE